VISNDLFNLKTKCNKSFRSKKHWLFHWIAHLCTLEEQKKIEAEKYKQIRHLETCFAANNKQCNEFRLRFCFCFAYDWGHKMMDSGFIF